MSEDNHSFDHLINECRKELRDYKQYNDSFLKLLRTQASIVDVIELINAKLDAEQQGKRFKW
ncbi:hypothetical protein [Bacillus toyonensis]|uniref:hypothetical protein n=1 Tax=Bacillus toyonensis TaxID=155322 RepID=UPI002E227600|nr:hypothetical protein [Bacillus toyonensis]